MGTEWIGYVHGVTDKPKHRRNRSSNDDSQVLQQIAESCAVDVGDSLRRGKTEIASDREWDRNVERASTILSKLRTGNKDFLKSLLFLASIPVLATGIVLYYTVPNTRGWGVRLGAWLIFAAAVGGGYTWVELAMTSLRTIHLRKGTGFYIILFSFILSTVRFVVSALFFTLLLGLWAGLAKQCPSYVIVLKIISVPLVLACCQLTSRLITKALAFNYHRSTFLPAMSEALSKEQWLEKLSRPRYSVDATEDTTKRIKSAMKSVAGCLCGGCDYSDSSSELSGVDSIREMNREELMEQPLSIARLERYLRKSRLVVHNHDSTSSSNYVEVADRAEATVLGNNIFLNLRGLSPDRYIGREVFAEAIGEEASEEAFAFFDHSASGRLTRGDIIEGVIEIYQQRQALALTLDDALTIVSKLGRIVFALVLVIGFIIVLAIFQVNLQSLWLTSSAVILGLSFIFGNTVRELFDAVVYVFVAHPFDVLDDVIVDGTQYKVRRLGLLTMEMERADGLVTHIPTMTLRCSKVHNVTRSSTKYEWFNVHVDFDTPLQAIRLLEQRVKDLANSEPTSYGPYTCLVIRELATPLKMSLMVVVQYAHNGSNLSRLNWDRSRVLQMIVNTFAERDIKYTLGGHPVHLEGPRGGKPGEGPPQVNGEATSPAGDSSVQSVI
mmetsp:Transcript_9329/g.28106  ORF Transcript_9329/g.28106 Transcript_9329/m.28106 type:complete len:667 (-) Transcript_9329:1986-3986(-)|eukprot:CAMPEP_0198731048 /NCGR_PEP_ID=MMETSP1475-20131203/27794_1 /TAXON_ID= ORGANISM="Unidentified sp., Strain CCMP1999" /NCGR_SAMPLE_ID=MMETSP1475 /ASSEMBLY_ACC=CAM_ASM_001111 /LENGTH=666 /DNA_ID=CAMNT_0044493951 /DNA_START=173 /DNA_END=2173 /DNA_ORIENTATION=-